jgi:hypothetical protein
MRSRAEAVRDRLDRVTHLPLAMWTVVHDKAGPRVTGEVMTFADLCTWADAAGVGAMSADPAAESVTYSACWEHRRVPVLLQCRNGAAIPEETP